MINNSHYVGKGWVKSQDFIQTCKPKKYKLSVLQKNCASYDKATSNIPTSRLTTRLLLQFPSTAKLCTPTLKISLDVLVTLSMLKESNCQNVIYSILNIIATDYSSHVYVAGQIWFPVKLF